VEEMPAPAHYRQQAAAVSVRAPFAAVESVGEERHSVTELVEKEIRVLPSSEDLLHGWQARTTGTRIHRALEALKYRSADEIAKLAAEDEAVRYVVELRDPPLREWIRDGETEWGFQVRTVGEGVVEGQIDLWAKHDGKLFVVDYKSGSPAYKESAFRQLSLYAWALRRFGHKEPAELVVVYPRLRQVERRAFSEDLFLHWERVLGVPEAAR
jgi:ATP-dependent helicase/nuclease subunit A